MPSHTESACSLVSKYPNVVVLQTMSKAFGLAGIRLGMAFAQEGVVQLMNNIKVRMPMRINMCIDVYIHLYVYTNNTYTCASSGRYSARACPMATLI